MFHRGLLLFFFLQSDDVPGKLKALKKETPKNGLVFEYPHPQK